MGYNILVCDDEKDIVSAIEIYLKSEGYNVICAYDGMQALEALEHNDIHLIIIDVMMPKLDGIEATSRIRMKHNIPIIILSAKSEYTDKAIGLNVGADDYITKPFNAIELLARVKSTLRRFTALGSMEKEEDVFSIGRITLNDRTKQVSADNNIVNLTPNEYGILRLLMKNKGRVFSSNEIYEQVWDQPAYHVKKVISVHISHLREKLEINPKEPDYIKSVYGMGYKIVGD
ncbi:response regulator transcription factor [Natronincola ferrireducens]|uniref:Stage 0 sporulation protein A homolog n=1 Tax=Natronincola ferrireducens TaxID=393762 RepID=A0A1G8Z5E1_9FIRM|nr:response regulator transcription factor [Natronincola ferrireducens]SDK09854.1 DNA-binding response regulator, OmpR family, contains REC and winged-helix (wHTH) domain [Natronincola ferrireducens]